MPKELDPLTYGLTIWDLDREFLTGGVGGKEKMALGDLLGVLRDAYCRTDRHRVHAHPGHRGAALDPVQGRGRPARRSTRRPSAASSSGSTPPRRSRSSSPPSTSAPSASAWRARSRRSRSSTRSSRRPPTPGSTRRSSAWPTGAASTCCRTSSARATTPSSASSRGTSTRRRCRGPATSSTTSGATGKYVSPAGADILLELAANPSHLETVGPIVEGMVRARQDQVDPPGSYPVLPIADPRRRRVRRPGRRRRDARR